MCAKVGFHLIKMDITLLFLICIASLQTTFAELTVKVEPPKETLLEGDNLIMMCSVNEAISKCKWQLLDLGNLTVIDFVVEPGAKLPEGIMYRGKGLKNGECGITILYVTEKHNGILTCGLFPRKNINSDGIYKSATVVVAKAPRAPQIKVTRMRPFNDSYPENTFDEYEKIQAECRIEFGRPEANISWFVGTRPIKYFLDPVVVEDVGPKGGGWKTIRQIMTKSIIDADNGKDLRCVANHIALEEGTLHHPIYTLNVYFRPMLSYKNIKPCKFFLGREAKILVKIKANPKPEITWKVDGHVIKEGGISGRFKAANLVKKGRDKWAAVLNILKIDDQDGLRRFYLTARNTRGESQTRVEISTCSPSF